MALSKKGRYWYGTENSDIQVEIARFSQLNKYEAVKFSAASCVCGGDTFKLESDEDAGAARRICTQCSAVKLMGDSATYASEATFDNHVCECDGEVFSITSGVALYQDSNDIRWYYIGCHCKKCNLVGVFAHWKCECDDADAFLAET